MKLEFSGDHVPGPRGSKTEYFLQKPRHRFVAATNCFTAITFLATSWITWPMNRRTSLIFLAMGLVTLLTAYIVRRHGTAKSRNLARGQCLVCDRAPTMGEEEEEE